MAAFGTSASREHVFSSFLLLWEALGLKIAYHKGARGTRVTWIGALIEATKEGAISSIPADKIKDCLDLLDNLLLRPLAPRPKLARWVGRLAWMAGWSFNFARSCK